MWVLWQSCWGRGEAWAPRGCMWPCNPLPLPPLRPLPGGARAAPQGPPSRLQQRALHLRHDATHGADHGAWHVRKIFQLLALPCASLGLWYCCRWWADCYCCAFGSVRSSVNMSLRYAIMLCTVSTIDSEFCHLCVCGWQSSWLSVNKLLVLLFFFISPPARGCDVMKFL